MARHTKNLTRSFAGGEMSPEMFSRMDDVKYQAGAETLLNCIPRATGAVARRSGTRIVRQTRASATTVAQLFSFVFSPTNSVVIEGSRATIGSVEGGYFRFHSNGGTFLYPKPGRYKPALNMSSTAAFLPARTVNVTVASPAKVQLTAHGLSNGDQVQFISAARTVPNGLTAFVAYYVVNKTANDFEIATTPTAGTGLAVSGHGGFYPVLYNWIRWRNVAAAKQAIHVSENRILNKEAVVMTMWPTVANPAAFFVGSTVKPVQVSGGIAPGLARTAVTAQQVMFVADSAAKTGGTSGAVLPSGIEEGRLYWVTAYSAGAWTLSKTFGGPSFDTGTGQVSTSTSYVRMCAMPELTAGSLGAQGEFGCLTTYYAIADPNAPNTVKLEASIATGQVAAGGFSFSDTAVGCGPFKLNRVYEIGATASFCEVGGAVKDFYSQKNWQDPELEADRNFITLEMHTPGVTVGSESRTPGSTYRTSAQQGAYWRELPGRSTGSVVAMTANEYGVGTDLTLTCLSGTGEHGFVTGQAVSMVDGIAPNGVTLDTTYFAVVDSTTTMRLSTTYALAIGVSTNPHADAIDGPGAELARHGALLVEGWVEFVTASDIVRWPSHGLSNGDTIVFSASDLAASGHTSLVVVLGTVYYVRTATTDTFQLSATTAGAIIELDGNEGTQVAAVGNSIYEVPHDYSEVELPRIITTQSGDVMTMTSQDHPVSELRRLSSSQWELVEPEFTASVAPPTALFESATALGEGTLIKGTGITAGLRHYFITGVIHTFTQGTPVYVDAFPASGLGSFTAGYYIVDEPSGVGNQASIIYLNSVESNDWTQHGGAVASGLTARIRYGTQGEDRTQSYVVTAVDENNEESAASSALSVSNNLFVSGASNTIGWVGSSGAKRYRVYKELSGLYGLIGETDNLTFKDDNIGPDLAVSPPIPDSSLRHHAKVTFDTTANSVLWAAHGLLAKTPVVFKTTDRLPGLDEGKTYYVVTNPGTGEFQVTTDLDTMAVVVLSGTDLGSQTAVAGDFPASVTHFEGRKVFGGSRAKPQDIWMTASGTENDLTYSIPTVDSDRISARITAREISAIRHMIPMSQLILLSDSTEYRLTPVNDEALTPTSISVRPQSFIGTGYPVPSLVNNTVVFAAARGGHMRELGYERDAGGYMTGDLSIRAAHLFDGLTIVDQAYSKAPLPVVWCVSSNGKLLGLTYIPEENVGAWHQHTTPSAGTFESVAVVPEGDEDAVYVIVKRTIDGITEGQYIERFADEYRGDTASLVDAFFVDSGLTYDGAATTTIAGLDHLNGALVSYLADGLVGTATVASGSITLATAASKVQVGLAFTTQIKTLPLSMMRVDAFGTGRQKNVNQVWVRTFQSGAFDSGPTAANLSPSREPDAGVLADALVQITIPPSWTDDGQIFIQQATPLPLTVSGLTIEVSSGG